MSCYCCCCTCLVISNWTKFAKKRSRKGGKWAMASVLSVPAVIQIISRLGKSEQEEQQLVEKLEKSCRNFDHSGRGSLSPDDYFNVIKLQNGIDISKEEVKNILAELPKDKDGKVKIDDFIHAPIHSDAAFKVLDRNRDGFITKGELKLAHKNIGMREIDQCVKDHDANQDGKLDKDEFDRS